MIRGPRCGCWRSRGLSQVGWALPVAKEGPPPMSSRRPRVHLTRYHGVFAPNFEHRHRIVPNPTHQSAREPPASSPAPMRWIQRLERVFHVDIERCGVCGGTLRVIVCIEAPLKFRSRSELAHSSRQSSPISPRARPAASITRAHCRSMRRKPNPRTPHLRHCPDCARRCTTARLRLASRALRPAPPCGHAFMSVGSKSRHLDRDSSALAPTSDPTTTTPILPHPSQSTRYSAYPSLLPALQQYVDGECSGLSHA